MIDAGFKSDKGRVREQNEDACLILPVQQREEAQKDDSPAACG